MLQFISIKFFSRLSLFQSRFTMDDHGPRVADYFVLTGLTEDSKPLEEEIQSEGRIKPQRNLAPITDIIIIIKSQGEKVT